MNARAHSSRRRHLAVAVTALCAAAALLPGAAGGPGPAGAATSSATRYVLTLRGDYAVVDGAAVGTSYGSATAAREAALAAVGAAGGTVTNDLSRQIGVLVVESPTAGFASLVQQYALAGGVSAIEAVSRDKAAAQPASSSKGKKWDGNTRPADPLEAEQWGMRMIRSDVAHRRIVGRRGVEVGILDSGVDMTHVDFTDAGALGGATNVDCARGHVSVPEAPVGVPGNACSGDGGAHGTHVAGIVAAQQNGVGVVGVAPGVTLVPVQVCDTLLCWWSAAIDGITYAGDARLDVINMSFYADDPDTTAQLTDCNAEDSATVQAVDRAVAYARSRGVTPVAALGNNGEDLAGTAYANCRVVPAESPGTIAVTALGPDGTLASYSNHGVGAADVTAPGGDGMDGDSSAAILSTIPGQYWLSLNGTSMASPHAAGVAALIVSRYGKAADGGISMRPADVERRLEGTAVDIGAPGYDGLYGYGRVDALRAIGG